MSQGLEKHFEETISQPALRNNEDLLAVTLVKLAHLNLTGRVFFDRSKPTKGGGGFGDVYTGTYKLSEHEKEMVVAVKCLRNLNPETTPKVAAKEIYIWSKLDHPNLLRLSGFLYEEGKLPCLVSEWMVNGSSLDYVRRHPECDVMHLILGIAEGLAYLHDNGVVHSDVKSDNVLVSSSGDAVICDFGISRALNATQAALGGNTTAPNGAQGTIRWMAHELIVKPDVYNKHTKETDIWAFGMTAYELLTKDRPYAHITIIMQIPLSAMRKELPPPPSSFDSWPKGRRAIWNVLKSCWKEEPQSRLSMLSVVTVLKALRTYATDEASPADFAVLKDYLDDKTGSETRHLSGRVLAPVVEGVEHSHEDDAGTIRPDFPQKDGRAMLDGENGLRWTGSTAVEDQESEEHPHIQPGHGGRVVGVDPVEERSEPRGNVDGQSVLPGRPPESAEPTVERLNQKDNANAPDGGNGSVIISDKSNGSSQKKTTPKQGFLSRLLKFLCCCC